jgi:hypothetical protein
LPNAVDRDRRPRVRFLPVDPPRFAPRQRRWDTWLQLAYAIALNGRATVLCGSLLPEHLEDLPARRLVGPVHCYTLDCPDAVLAERLRARSAWRASSAEAAIVGHQRFAARLRARIQPTSTLAG